jgi:anti-sigma-K factor RskA
LTNESHIHEEDLQLYALGALPEPEAAPVRLHLAGCNICAAQLVELRAHASLLVFGADQRVPSPAPKQKLFARIAAERAPEPARVVREQKRRFVYWWNWILAPATLALVILSVALWRQNLQLFAELRDAQRIASDFEKERVHVQKVVNALTAPETITVELAGTSDAANSTGIVKYNRESGLMVYTADLPPLPSAKVYQMWLVPRNGAPISAGIFLPPAPGQPHVWTAELPGNKEPKAFAVTIEPAGGVDQPTGPKVLLGAS